MKKGIVCASFQDKPKHSLANALRRPPWYVWVSASLACSLGFAALLLHFGGYLLVTSDPLPKHAQVAVVLAGSVTAEETRRAEALRMLKQGLTDHVMLGVGKISYWGQWLPDMVRRYIAKEYGGAIAKRVVLCEMNVQSTTEEAFALRQCLEERGWRSIIIVTSNYHTRRARLIWAAVLAKADQPFAYAVHGVADGEFEPRGWWRKRRYAKTWLLEAAKLIWSYIEPFRPPHR